MNHINAFPETCSEEEEEVSLLHKVDACFLIGLGGVGSNLVEPLSRFIYFNSPDIPLILLDGDTYELSNQARQLFDPSADGLNKAQYHGQKLQSYGLNVTYYPHYLSADYLQNTVKKCQCPLIIAAVDNDATRNLILKHLSQNHTDFFWVSPANGTVEEGNSNHAQVLFWGRVDGQDIGLDPRALYQNLRSPMDFIPRKNSCIEKAASDTQIITANVMASALALAVVDNLFNKNVLYTSVEMDYGMSAMLSTHSIYEYMVSQELASI